MKIATRFTLVMRVNWDSDAFFEGASGTIDVDPEHPMVALEDLFEKYNHGSGGDVQFDHRSLSVGDKVRLGETTWVCNSFGWSPDHEGARAW